MAFDAGQITATLDLDRSPFVRSLAQARKSAADFARQTYQASLGVRGSAETVAELKGVDQAADRVDGRNVDLDVDSDGRGAAHLQSLSGGFKSLAGNIRATSTVLAASTIPFAIAGIGAATPAVLALGASLGGLALNLGKAAAGFGLVGAAAGGGALVGLKAYGSLISKTLSDSRTLWEQENTKAVEALKKQRLEILKNARGFDAWNKQINSSLLGFTHLEAAVGSRIFPVFTRELAAWTGKLREMRPFIADTAGRISQIAVGFSRWFRTADDGQVLREVVGFLSESAIRAARGLSQIAQIGVSAFRPLIPLASDLQGEVLGILSATNKWVQSAEGQSKLGRVYDTLWGKTKRLAPVVLDLWRGTVQLFDALDRSGIADQASRGFASLASAYERATRAGGGLDRFLRGALRLMPFVGRATMDVVRAVGNIAQAAIGARVHGSRLTILQSIFRGIGAAARPLQRLVVGTFRDLGPEIAKLIPQVARFFSVFAGSSGPLVTFVRVIRRALEIFNNLPQPIKQAAVNLAALKLILGGLGVGAVVGPMGRFASNMLLARGAAAKLAGKSALAGVAGGLARIGALLVGGIGLGLLAAGLVHAYRKNEQFRDSVNRLADKVKPAFERIQTAIDTKVLPALGRLSRRGANAIIDIFDLDGGQKSKIEQNGRSAVQRFGYGASQQGKKLVSSDWVAELGRKIGQQIGKGLNAWARGGGGGGDWLSRILGTNSNPVNFGARLGENIKKGMNNTNWRAVGERITKGIRGGIENADWKGMGRSLARRVILGVTGLGIAADVSKWITKGIRGAVDKVGWDGIGRYFVKRFVLGVTGLGIAGDISKWIVREIKKIHAGDLFKSLGKNAAKGFIVGFRKNLPGGALVDAVNRAREAVKNFQKEHSPSRLWMEQGKNAGLGYVGGFAAGLKPLLHVARKAAAQLKTALSGGVPADINRSINAAVAHRVIDPGTGARARHVTQRATLPGSVGGRSITASEMRDIMLELPDRMTKGIANEVVKALKSDAYASHLDNSLGGYIRHRNAAGADPR